MQESQTKVASAVQAVFDAQIAMQKEFFAAATAGFKGALALERDGLKAAARAAEQGVEYARANTRTVPDSVKSWVGVVPGMDPELADRLAKDTEAAINALNTTAEKSVTAAREAATVATRQVEQFLTEMEARGMEGLKVAETSAEKTVQVARDVTAGTVETAYAAADKTTETAKSVTPQA